MPTRKQESGTDRAAGVPSLAVPAASPGLAIGALVLPGPRGPWTYCVSPTALGCWRRRIVPRLAKAWHTPGLCGNGHVQGRGEGFVAALGTWGFLPVSHAIECEAFGAPRRGALSNYLDRYEGHDATGRPVVYHADAWHRPRQLGHVVVWDFDADGWLDFLSRCLALVTPASGLDPVQIELATRPVLQAVRSLQDRSDPRAGRLLDERLAHLPSDFVPHDLVARWKAVQEPSGIRRRRTRDSAPEPEAQPPEAAT